MASRTETRPLQAGELRSVLITGYFTVPWDYPEGRIAWEVYLAKFIAQNEKEGWRFERLEGLGKDPIPDFKPDGEGYMTYNLRVRFSRPAQRTVLEMPDSWGEALVAKNPRRFQHANAAPPRHRSYSFGGA